MSSDVVIGPSNEGHVWVINDAENKTLNKI